jgi:branched-chain amino acid transport system permease protein
MSLVRATPPPRSVVPGRLATAVVAGLAVIAVLTAVIPPYWLFLCATAALSAVVLLGLGVVSGGAGMIALCQLSFAAVGAWVVSWLWVHRVAGGLLLWTLLGALAAAAVGVLVGLPALRLRGVHLAVVTLGFALAVDVVLASVGFPSTAALRPVPRPSELSTDRAYFAFVAVVFLLAAVALALLGRSRLGASWRAVRFSERATAATGASVARTKLSAFAVGAALAGVGGGLLAGQIGLLVPQSFDTMHSLVFYVLAVISGALYWDGALLGGLLGTFLPELFRQVGISQDWANALFGVAAVQALAGGATGVERGRRALANRRRAEREAAVAAAPAPPPAPAPSPAPDRPGPGAPLLVVRGLAVTYGTVAALREVGLTVRADTVTGLIGPNGAGKSTLVDAITGFVPVSAGDVELDGRALGGLPPHRRVSAGVRRTFQQDRVPPTLSAGEYLRFASHRRVTQTELDTVAEHFGCPPLDLEVRSCTAADRRLLEVAGATLRRPRLLVLDEPASGMARHEALALAERLAQVPARFGAAVLVIEHNLEFVRRACDGLIVLNFGQVIADGRPDEVLASAAVRRAYLGDEAVLA